MYFSMEKIWSFYFKKDAEFAKSKKWEETKLKKKTRRRQEEK